jgi:iron-sulfur cluster assembly protein
MDTVNIENATGATAPAEAKGIQVTDKAVAHIRAVLAKENISPNECGLRLGVQGGGCSGMSYVLRFESRSDSHDHVFEFGDARVFIDPKSFIYLRGMTLDFEETLMRQGFVFNNPNATKSCGCGTSFS